MGPPERRKSRSSRSRPARGDPRFRVFGLWTVVRMMREDGPPYAVQCPRGQPIQYGTVVSLGDGFDTEAGAFRELPPLGAIVAFEETAEGIEGHYFFDGEDEYRILHLDAINVAFPPPEGC